MAVNLSPVGGVAAQFFDNDGNVLSGGKIYTYSAGTSTPATTYTNSTGSIPHSNPIVLDSAGRVPSGEIWLTDGINYKFVVNNSSGTLIGTYDNISGINSNFLAFTSQQQIITATANQTVFNLSISYQPGTNSLSVFVDGVNQYGPGAQYAYTETSSTSVTFTNGLHVGALVKFTTTQQQGAGAVNASQVTYDPAGAGAVATNVQTKLRETVSVKDFGASPSNTSGQNTTAFQNALNAHDMVYVPDGTYLCGALTFNAGNFLLGESRQNTIITYTGSTSFITGGADLNRVGLENLSIGASSTPSGYGVFFDLSTVRQPRFVNVAITGFASAIRIDDALNGWIEQVYLGGQGSGVSGSVGLQFGESPSQSGTTWQTNNVYVTGFQTGVKTWATASMFNTLIIELCSIGVYSSAPCTVISPWFDTVTTEFSLFLNGICIIGPRWANATPAISVDSTTTFARTTVIPATGDVNSSFAPSWKMGFFDVWSNGALQHDYLQLGQSANYNFSIRPNTNYTHAIERKTTASTGYSFTLQSGGAKSGETNTSGGTLLLSGGIATGSGESSVEIYTATAGASGTTDITPTRKWLFGGNGKFYPNADGTYDIGSTTARVQRVYAKEGFVVTTPDGTKNYLISVSNAGALTTTLI